MKKNKAIWEISQNLIKINSNIEEIEKRVNIFEKKSYIQNDSLETKITEILDNISYKTFNDEKFTLKMNPTGIHLKLDNISINLLDDNTVYFLCNFNNVVTIKCKTNIYEKYLDFFKDINKQVMLKEAEHLLEILIKINNEEFG